MDSMQPEVSPTHRSTGQQTDCHVLCPDASNHCANGPTFAHTHTHRARLDQLVWKRASICACVRVCLRQGGCHHTFGERSGLALADINQSAQQQTHICRHNESQYTHFGHPRVRGALSTGLACEWQEKLARTRHTRARSFIGGGLCERFR